MPDVAIENVTLRNIEIRYPGGGDPNYARVGLNELDKVPEMAASYPEFSMFKELPAWGFYIRHAKNLKFENIILSADRKDYRTAIVLDDVHGMTINSLKVTEPGAKKEPVFNYKSTDIAINRK
jgi:pectate lyase